MVNRSHHCSRELFPVDLGLLPLCLGDIGQQVQERIFAGVDPLYALGGEVQMLTIQAPDLR